MSQENKQLKVTIGTDGLLSIRRKRKLREMYCPFDEDGAQCGDWCPLFNEPEYPVSRQGTVKLKICKNTFILYTHEFKDERK